MKTDLDRLMQENNIDAILVTGPAQHNPAVRPSPEKKARGVTPARINQGPLPFRNSKG